MSFEDSLRQLTKQIMRIWRNEAIAAGVDTVYVTIDELDTLIGMDEKETTQQLTFVPPDLKGDTQEVPTLTNQDTQPCKALW